MRDPMSTAAAIPKPFNPRDLIAGNTRRAPAPTASVDCGSCTTCCRKELVILTANDGPSAFKTWTIVNPLTGEPCEAIPLKDDGACHYLGEAGCTIYDRRPEMCRAFTCVGWVLGIMGRTTRAQRRRDMKAGLLDRETWEAGTSRLPACTAKKGAPHV